MLPSFTQKRKVKINIPITAGGIASTIKLMKLHKSLEPADFAASLVDLLFRSLSQSTMRL